MPRRWRDRVSAVHASVDRGIRRRRHRTLTELLGRNGVAVVPEGDFTVVVTDDYLRPELATWNAQVAGVRKGLASGEAGGHGDLDRSGVRAGSDRMLGVPRSAAPGAPQARAVHRAAQRHGRCRSVPRPPASRRPSTQPSPKPQRRSRAGSEPEGNRPSSTAWCRPTSSRSNAPTTPSPAARSARRAESPEPTRRHAPAGPVRLRRRPKVHTSDGGHRARDPRRCSQQLDRHLSPITGIVSTLVPGERTGAAREDGRWLTPTFAADHNFSDMHDDRFFLREGHAAAFGRQGKEHRAGAYQRAGRVAGALLRRLRRNRAADPRLVCGARRRGHSPERLHGVQRSAVCGARRPATGRGHKAHWVPEPFREDVEIEWTPLWSLSAERTRYLPTSFCYFGYRSPDPLFARADSNGCAAGSVPEEAVLQGLLELVERDAVAHLVVQPAARGRPWISRAPTIHTSRPRRHYGELRRELWALDVTSDFGVPTFAAISRRVDTGRRGHHLRFRRTSRPGRRSGPGVDGAEPVVGSRADSHRPGVDAKTYRGGHGCRALVAHGHESPTPAI